jgi:hypothetical protein
MAEVIYHKELAIKRLAVQYKESTKLIAYIEALLVEADTLEAVFQSLLADRWIDTAEGVNLDILGAIVGQPRILIDATILSYFGYLTAPGAQSFGSVLDPALGGRFRGVDEATAGNRGLTDEEYRVFIRARVIKNSTLTTIQEIIDAIKFVVGVEQVILVEGTTFYTIQIGKELTTNEKIFISNTDLIPKPAGVGVGYQEYDATAAFGFGGIPTSRGFGTTLDPNVGGKFASII